MDKDKLMMKGVVIIDKDLLKNIRGGDGDESDELASITNDELGELFAEYGEVK